MLAARHAGSLHYLVEQLAVLLDLCATTYIFVFHVLHVLYVKAVVALITNDVHNRDIVSSLVEQGTAAVSDFSWQMQLRFEYDADTDSIMARQVNAR